MRLTLVLGAISLFILSYQWGNQYQRRSAEPPAIGGLLIRPPSTVPDFELLDPLGRPLGQDDLRQGWTLLAFGDLSRASGQLAVQRLIDVYNRVADERSLQRELRLVLVATADTPDLARDFASLLPALHVLGGDAEQITRLRDGLGLGPEETPALFVFGPGGYLVAFLPDDLDGAVMAEDLKAIHASAFVLLPEGV
ncbi:MAG: hypothetical protein LJE61_04445 [Thiocapsa sp.]|jgi:hypothetical protein|nr:hypothetical protein [Thiocapsa sp.]MCG6895665.1 hypothetical protein [Thiocapsa sp.]MCG6984441.1 hypothetical protein [Thiocapsa sp.]